MKDIVILKLYFMLLVFIMKVLETIKSGEIGGFTKVLNINIILAYTRE